MVLTCLQMKILVWWCIVLGSQIFVTGKALKADLFSAEYRFTAYPLLACSLRGFGSLMDIYV